MVPLQRMDNWRSRVVWRVDAHWWELEVKIPLELELGDQLVSILTDSCQGHSRPKLLSATEKTLPSLTL